MKITLNLSPGAGTHERFALAWAIPVTLVAAVALVLLCRASLREYRQNIVIQRQLAEVQMRTEELRNQEAAVRRQFEHPTYGELLRRAKFINNLIDQRELSLTELSARLAGLLPEDAHLTGLALTSPRKPGEDYTVRMGITAKNEVAVQTFVNDLEDSVDFKDVAIVNEGFQEESSQPQQVNLMCTARYLPGAESESEEKSPESAAQSPESKGTGQQPGARREELKVISEESQVRNQKPKGGIQKPGVGSQKVEKPVAKKPTPNRKPNI